MVRIMRGQKRRHHPGKPVSCSFDHHPNLNIPVPGGARTMVPYRAAPGQWFRTGHVPPGPRDPARFHRRNRRTGMRDQFLSFSLSVIPDLSPDIPVPPGAQIRHPCPAGDPALPTTPRNAFPTKRHPSWRGIFHEVRPRSSALRTRRAHRHRPISETVPSRMVTTMSDTRPSGKRLLWTLFLGHAYVRKSPDDPGIGQTGACDMLWPDPAMNQHGGKCE